MSPAEIIESASQSFRHDLWQHQKNRVEVWVEKDALIGVLGPVCEETTSRISHVAGTRQRAKCGKVRSG
jgi:hypothetical protein